MESDATPSYAVLFELWATSKTLPLVFDDVLRRHGVGTGRELAALGLLLSAGELSPSDLASWTGMPPATVTAFLKRLEDRGDITRRPNPDDGRSSLVSLSETGRPRFEAAFAECAALFDRIEERLSVPPDEIRAALRALDDAMRDAIGAERRPPISQLGADDQGLPKLLEEAGLTPEEERKVARYISELRS